MIEVYEIKKVPKNCSSCLYGVGINCYHSDRKHDWMKYATQTVHQIDSACPSFWLDRHRFIPVDDMSR